MGLKDSRGWSDNDDTDVEEDAEVDGCERGCME